MQQTGSAKTIGGFQKFPDHDNKIMLLLYKQMYYGQSLCSIFGMLGSQVQEENISRYLLEIFWEVVNVIAQMFKIDCMVLFEEIIRGNLRADEIMRLFSPVLKKKSAA